MTNNENITPEDLDLQLIEYRKAIRAMMWLTQASNNLKELIADELDKLNVFEIERSNFTLERMLEEEWVKPKGVSFEAFAAVASICSWELYGILGDKPKVGSIYFVMHCYFDYDSSITPEESSSSLYVYIYRPTKINGRAVHSFDDAIDELVFEEHEDIENGQPKEFQALKIYPELGSAFDGKYCFDVALGFYNISKLVDPQTVKDTVLSDVKQRLKDWGMVA